jgi:hypothetical protein
VTRRALLLLALTGCLHAPAQHALLGAAPPDPQAVAACRSTRNWHNVWTVSAGAAGGAAGVAGAAESIPTDSTGKLVVGLVSLAFGIASIIGGAAAGVTAANYSDSRCDTVLQ